MKRFTYLLIWGFSFFFLLYIFLSLLAEELFPKRWRNLVYKSSSVYKLEPLFVAAIIGVESNFSPIAVSPRDAIGLMQILPSTGRELASKLNLKFDSRKSLFDPNFNLKVGTYYLHLLLKEFNHNRDLALAAYNAGIKRIKDWTSTTKKFSIKNIPISETRKFISAVNTRYLILKILQNFGFL
jgi:soluble lytic murein transglycosylase